MFLMSLVTVHSTWLVLLPGFLVGGVGIGMVNAPLASTAVSTVRVERAGMASGINNTFRQVGIATGIAALGAIFQNQVHGEGGHGARAGFRTRAGSRIRSRTGSRPGDRGRPGRLCGRTSRRSPRRRSCRASTTS